VVAADGTEAGPRRGTIRALAFPLSFLLCGLGFTGIFLQRNRRALHDLIAGTAVVYTWDARAAPAQVPGAGYPARSGVTWADVVFHPRWVMPPDSCPGSVETGHNGRGEHDLRSPAGLDRTWSRPATPPREWTPYE
jgi:hypothetical protein